jgi:FSR family fosmidomycin resistance protein-like MFS transporter
VHSTSNRATSPPDAPGPRQRVGRHFRRVSAFALVLLAIEFLDEFVYGAREAAWPLIRDDLGLTYAQVGLLLGVPNVVGNLVEPFLGILGDVWKRRALILGGGVIFAGALLLTALSHRFVPLLLSFILFYPASGAFVSLSQATLMDLAPSRHEQNMVRWTFAGSLGVVMGPLVLGATAALALSWHVLFAAFAGLTLILVAVVWCFPCVAGRPEPGAKSPGDGIAIRALAPGLRGALAALRRREVLRWLVLLEFSDLLLDVLLGFLALYMVDVAGATPIQAGTAVVVWSGVGLLGDFLLIPLLERVRGLSYLRVSVVAELILYPAFLLMPSLWAKFAVLGLLGLFNAGWYAILQARLYSAMPGQSGTAMAVKNVSGLIGGLFPLALGLIAQRAGLPVAMWLLLLGPVVLLAGLPHSDESGMTQNCRDMSP